MEFTNDQLKNVAVFIGKNEDRLYDERMTDEILDNMRPSVAEYVALNDDVMTLCIKRLLERSDDISFIINLIKNTEEFKEA